MISHAQKALLKRAQREADLSDDEYRDALQAAAGVRSSTDPAMTDRSVDLVLAYFEAILWRRIDAGELQQPRRPDAVFRQRGFWASKNPRGCTSRDRYNGSSLAGQVSKLEAEIHALGFNTSYTAAIRSKVTNGRTDDRTLYSYCAALKRTLAAKQSNFGELSPG